MTEEERNALVAKVWEEMRQRVYACAATMRNRGDNRPVTELIDVILSEMALFISDEDIDLLCSEQEDRRMPDYFVSELR